MDTMIYQSFLQFIIRAVPAELQYADADKIDQDAESDHCDLVKILLCKMDKAVIH